MTTLVLITCVVVLGVWVLKALDERDEARREVARLCEVNQALRQDVHHANLRTYTQIKRHFGKGA